MTPTSLHTNTQLAAISAYVMPDIPEAKADIGLLFGTRHGVPQFCRTAHSLWQRQLFSKLVISGGHTAGGHLAEARHIADELQLLGVPDDALILETEAMNTGENVIFSRQKIAETIGLDGINSVLIIGKICAMRRYLMTMERHWPGLEIFASPVNYFGVDKHRWHEHAEFRARVLAEFAKIPVYLQQDFLRELPDAYPAT